MKHIFGPVPSRRFGLSLGIDLSPDRKSCNFDCLYCELEPAKPTDTIEHPAPVSTITQEVQKALHLHPDVEVLTITANGEPTLYPYLNDLVDELKQIKKDKELLILSNASTIHEPVIQNTLKKIDIVKLSLDCATPRCFKRLDRPLKTIDLDKIIEGMKAFRHIYDGLLVIETLVVRGINDKPEEFEVLREVLEDIGPDRIDLGTVDRPPAYEVEPVSYERLFELSKILRDLPVCVVGRSSPKSVKERLGKEEILHLLALRPLSKEDIKNLFDHESLKIFQALLRNGKLDRKRVGKVEFYETKR